MDNRKLNPTTRTMTTLSMTVLAVFVDKFRSQSPSYLRGEKFFSDNLIEDFEIFVKLRQIDLKQKMVRSDQREHFSLQDYN